MTLGELCFLIYVAAAGLACATWAGANHGLMYGVVGFFAGLLIAVLVPTIFVMLPHMAFLKIRALYLRRGDSGRSQ